MTALEQVLAFWAWLVVAWWISIMEHGDDGVVVRRHRLAERLGHAATIDPGMRLSKSQVDGET